MPSQTFICPHCRRQLTKSAQAYVLGEAIEQNATFFGFGQMPAHIVCPGCGHPIDTMKMVRGEFDAVSSKATGKNDGWHVLGMLVAPFIFKFVFHWSWVASILVGLLAGALAVQIVIEIIKSSTGKKQY